MSADPSGKILALKAQIQEKVQKLLTDFAEGTLSREQFHAVYERYTSQLAMADMAMRSSSPDTVMEMMQDGTSTMVVKEKYMGKAVGMTIYNNRSGTLLETLGDFEVPPEKLSPIFNDFSLLMQSGKLAQREVRKISAKQWLVFAAGRYTTVVTLFHNEPSEQQNREIERLHHDFEQANAVFFEKGNVDADKLAYPFLVFVQQKMKKK